MWGAIAAQAYVAMKYPETMLHTSILPAPKEEEDNSFFLGVLFGFCLFD